MALSQLAAAAALAVLVQSGLGPVAQAVVDTTRGIPLVVAVLRIKASGVAIVLLLSVAQAVVALEKSDFLMRLAQASNLAVMVFM